jgi:small-conductance mechanosensitive channel
MAQLAVAAPVAAQDDDQVTVRIDGRAVVRVGAAGELNADARARQIERRLGRLLETPQAIGPARIERGDPADTSRVIIVSGIPVATVTRSDAEENFLPLDALASQWARAIEATLSRAKDRRSTPGARFVAEVEGSVQTAFARTLESAITVVPRVLAALLVVALFWLVAAAVRRLLRAVLHRVIRDRTVEDLVRQTTYYAIWVLGLIIAVDALGFAPETVVTGLGLTGLTLGFALKDIISNFVSGLLILAIRPFQIGDQIVVGETEGSVERIRLRATEMRTYGGRLVLVPNAELFTSRITNNTASPVRRARAKLFLGYDVDLQHASQVAQTAAAQVPGVLADPPVKIRIGELGEGGLVMEVLFWADSRRSDFVATLSAVRMSVVETRQSAGIRLPDPATRLLKTGEHPDEAQVIPPSASR